MNNIKVKIGTIGIVIALIIAAGYYYTIKKRTINNELLAEISQIQMSDIVLGHSDAPQSIIIFFDYNCQFCKRFFQDAYPKLNKEYIQTGKVNLVIKLVCGVNDKFALRAYQTVICINNYGKLEKLHKLLLHESKVIYTEQFNMLIEDYISTNELVGECILESDNASVLSNIYQFDQLKTKGTPTFVINNKVMKGYKNYKAIINKLK